MNSTMERLGWVLLHSGWQFTLIAVAVRAVLPLLRRQAATARYGLLVAALALSVITSATTWFALPNHAPAAVLDVGLTASRTTRQQFEALAKRGQRPDVAEVESRENTEFDAEIDRDSPAGGGLRNAGTPAGAGTATGPTSDSGAPRGAPRRLTAS